MRQPPAIDLTKFEQVIEETSNMIAQQQELEKQSEFDTLVAKYLNGEFTEENAEQELTYSSLFSEVVYYSNKLSQEYFLIPTTQAIKASYKAYSALPTWGKALVITGVATTISGFSYIAHKRTIADKIAKIGTSATKYTIDSASQLAEMIVDANNGQDDYGDFGGSIGEAAIVSAGAAAIARQLIRSTTEESLTTPPSVEIITDSHEAAEEPRTPAIARKLAFNTITHTKKAAEKPNAKIKKIIEKSLQDMKHVKNIGKENVDSIEGNCKAEIARVMGTYQGQMDAIYNEASQRIRIITDARDNKLQAIEDAVAAQMGKTEVEDKAEAAIESIRDATEATLASMRRELTEMQFRSAISSPNKDSKKKIKALKDKMDRTEKEAQKKIDKINEDMWAKMEKIDKEISASIDPQLQKIQQESDAEIAKIYHDRDAKLAELEPQFVNSQEEINKLIENANTELRESADLIKERISAIRNKAIDAIKEIDPEAISKLLHSIAKEGETGAKAGDSKVAKTIQNELEETKQILATIKTVSTPAAKKKAEDMRKKIVELRKELNDECNEVNDDDANQPYPNTHYLTRTATKKGVTFALDDCNDDNSPYSYDHHNHLATIAMSPYHDTKASPSDSENDASPQAEGTLQPDL